MGLSPPNKHIAPPNEMKPICPYGLGLMFFAKFVSIKLIKKFDQLKEPAACRNLFSLRKIVAQISAKISPPNQKSWLRPWCRLVLMHHVDISFDMYT